MLDEYLRRFSTLRTDRSHSRWSEGLRGRAPHKPLLLLSVIDLIGQGILRSNYIEPGTELGEAFSGYWTRIMPPDKRGNMAYPFFHLKSERFWHLVPVPGKESLLEMTNALRSLAQLSGLALGARLDEELFTLLHVPNAREKLRQALLATYFSEEVRVALIDQQAVSREAYEYSQRLLESAKVKENTHGYGQDTKLPEQARSQGFKRAVVTAYAHRCALCGIKMITTDGHIAVDAAHIIPWRLSRDDDPRNGLALCRLCHWAFDEGLLTISKRYKVLASKEMIMRDNMPGHLTTLQERDMIKPTDEQLMPRRDAIEWHYENVFRTGHRLQG